jgi:Fe-S-cluster containining protein
VSSPELDPGQELLLRLRKDKTQGAVQRATQQYLSAADTNADGYVKSKGLSLACRQGCALCCVFRVHVRAHEVFAILNYVEANFSADEKSALLVRLENHAARIAPMTRKEHETTNVPCPLLVDSKCSIYPVRPFGCRSHHSLDLAACQYSYDHPQDSAFPNAGNPEYRMLWHQMAAYAHGAFEGAGFDKQEYELGTAILAALKNPASARRWRDGKNPLLGQSPE